ncbi:NAD(P)-dependent dehydrogenase, short-chain alcohol dehydrogenase family [Kaistia soli DSM 19436]|uniref:NAD(P)-dependent dehydrogenase, short-chain alcohol dehydrogenase family n=2 Tax=Kaistia TaxID=166953 RepID=A0A1M4WU54_9HYPH|nr:glucose 1-dehydrogenase [Kaistia soli]SHE84502.1 NAD(P)-dependent dehydrogenase, short-chain alcohol dehydrogenase family [Kaistia soli DSM 19436]
MAQLPSFDLSGRVALVTGAGRGLGRASALALAAAGANVALGLRNAAEDHGLVAEIANLGSRAMPLQLDVRDLGQMRLAVDEAIAAFGRIDILVNNAGGGIPMAPIESVSEEDFDAVLDVNVRSTFFLSQYVGRHMIERRGGAIINIGSQAGAVALPGEGVYCLSKAAVAHMTKCFAIEWGIYGVRVNCIAPTFIRTDGTADMLADEAFRADVIDRIAALHRIGEPHEVSGVVAFLASDAAAMITGQTILVDGGWTAR